MHEGDWHFSDTHLALIGCNEPGSVDYCKSNYNHWVDHRQWIFTQLTYLYLTLLSDHNDNISNPKIVTDYNFKGAICKLLLCQDGGTKRLFGSLKFDRYAYLMSCMSVKIAAGAAVKSLECNFLLPLGGAITSSPTAYLSEMGPLMKDPIKTPTKNKEVDKGTFHACSHTRSHCNRREDVIQVTAGQLP